MVSSDELSTADADGGSSDTKIVVKTENVKRI